MGIWRDLQRFLPSKEIWPPSLAVKHGRFVSSHLGDRWAGEQITGFRSHWVGEYYGYMYAGGIIVQSVCSASRYVREERF